MTTGTVPQNMKVAKVIPIFKSGDKHKFNNYRPISILPAFSKKLEKVMSIKLTSYLEAQHLFYEHQYGFRPQHNTIHPIIHLTNQIAVENDKPTKDLTLSVFIDLSKAFDTISHKILLCKMEQLGIRGVANAWFNSYLTNREQYIELYNLKSSKKSISCGLPQGSILGPIFF
jgi:retron-type reverse transcriptase